MNLQWLSKLLGFVMAVLSAGNAIAQPVGALPPQEPQLVIDPGMHTAQIKRIGVDASCTMLATGSDDKTVRLWRLPEGKLVRTLRPPIGPGFDGRVFAVAVPPDGSWVAAGGWNQTGGTHWVYIFETATGAVATRLGPLYNVINHLAISPDGRYLAAALWGGQGLRVWERTGDDLATWRLVAEDKDYGGKDSYGAAFGRRGTLYTVAFDGKLRSYAPGYTAKPTLADTRGGKEPFSVAVHPSTDRVAVGFAETPAVEVYDAATLAWRFAADTKNVDNGSLANVAWSADGAWLYAGGQYGKGGRRIVRAWERAGEGSFREVEGPLNTISHLLPCNDAIAIGAQDPAFALLESNGGRRLWRESVQADMRVKLFEHFTVSADARRVRFGLKIGSSEPVLFDLATERLTDAVTPAQDFNLADVTSLPITDWQDRYDPKFAGRQLTLQQYEKSRAVAIAPDKQRFILGADWSIHAYTKDGNELWQRQVPGTVWGVNITRSGNLVIAAYGDGTIRWHRLADGQELLALFVHAKDRRWVAWTPKGYYTASAGGENLIGWHVNRKWNEAADFFPVSKYRDTFYRPDIVARILDDGDEITAISEANLLTNKKRQDEDIRKRQPPVISIVSQIDGAEVRDNEIVVEYAVRSPSKLPITGVRAYIDDRPAGEGQKGFIPVSADDNRMSLRVPVPPHDATLSLVALTEFGASDPARVRLHWVGPKVQEQLPTLYALVIGVAKYAKPGLDLKFAAKDADDFAAELAKQEGKFYRQVVVQKLTNENATGRNILLGLEWLKDNVKTRNDRAVLFFSGHGVTTPELASYLLPQDVEPTKLIATGLNKRVLLDVLRGLPGRVLVFLDACHAAGGLEAAGVSGARHIDTVGLVNEFADAQNGIVSFVSSQGNELSYEDDNWRNGAFTSALVEGLEGKAAGPGEKEILTVQLYLWLLKRVHSLTNDRQTPIMHSPPSLAPFAVALAK
jgi:Caspase domain/WD domain, G-beta repeat